MNGLLIFLVVLVVLLLYLYFFLRHARFGKRAASKRLELIRQSPIFRKGKFQNLSVTPSLTEGYSIMEVLYEFLFKRTQGRKPPGLVPSQKTNLHELADGGNVLVWFGHSSYFIQLDGKRILVDSVFSGNASPLAGSNRAFDGSDIYKPEDIPAIDYLFITHDHYDHLDHRTLVALRGKIKTVICGLGVGAHLEHWGYPGESVIETDWFKRVELNKDFVIHATPARHFSRRAFSRNNTLWLSFVLHSPTMKIYIGGDSGYDRHFADIGKKYGPFDLAILDNGQYDIKWKYIHMRPEEVLQAGKDLGARKLFPVHSGKFMMANHAWDEPLSKIAALAEQDGSKLITPMIGQLVNLADDGFAYQPWWKMVK